MDTKGISKLDLKRRNRQQILLAIREAGMLARVDIAAQLSLTRAAVTIITNQMITQNILEDLNGPVSSQTEDLHKKGRKKTMIRIKPDFRYVLGAVINERSISVGLSDMNNAAVDHRFLTIDTETKTEEMISFLVGSCRELMQQHSLNAKQILGLGIGIVPARWEQLRAEEKEGEISFSRLCYLLEMELSIPVLADSAIGLYAFAGIDYQNPETANQLLIYSGSCFHSAVIFNQELIGGFQRDTSAIDRIILHTKGTACSGYPDGSVHAELTRQALLSKAAAVSGPLTMEQLNEAYTAGDPQITKIMNDVLDDLALLIYNLCTANGLHCATLQCFRISEKAHTVLTEKVAALTGSGDKIHVRFSDIDGEDAFRAGSALVIEKLFFDQGGMLPGEFNV